MCVLQNTKRSLVELISNLNMDLNVPLDHDERAHYGSDGDDSSVDAAIADLHGPAARPLTPSSAAAALSPGRLTLHSFDPVTMSSGWAYSFHTGSYHARFVTRFSVLVSCAIQGRWA